MKTLITALLMIGSVAHGHPLKFKVYANEHGTDTVVDYTAYANPKLVQVPESQNSEKFCDALGGTVQPDGFEIDSYWFEGDHCLID